MKCIYLLLVVLLSAGIATAQVEYFFAHPDTNFNLGNVTHVLDEEGNIYMLSDETNFFRSAGTRFEGSARSNFCKIDKAGTRQWAFTYKRYGNSTYSAPAFELFAGRKDTLIVPVFINERKGTLLLDARTGAQLLERQYDDTTAARYTVQNSFYSRNTLSSFYSARASLFLQKQNERFEQVRQLQVDTALSTYFPLIAYDDVHREYLFASIKNYLAVCDEQLRERVRFSLYNLSAVRYVSLHKLVTNGAYYVVNYSATPYSNPDTSITFLLIMDRVGRIISHKPSLRFRDMLLTKDNALWVLYNQVNFYVGAAPYPDKPIRVMQMNLTQEVQRSVDFGLPLTTGRKMSLYRDEELVVTGSLASNATGLYPAQSPGQLYVYRQPVWTIPPVQRGPGCEGVLLAPNPAMDIVHLTIAPSGIAADRHEVAVINSIGQQVMQYTFSGPAASLDLSAYPTGMYFIRIADSAKQCGLKVFRQ